LSSRVPVAYIDIRVFVHATEDMEKVLAAVHNVLPTELVGKVAFKKTGLTGHYKNPLILFETRVKEKDAVEAVFKKLSSGLDSLDKKLLNEEIKQHLDKGNLYIRLDKQSAYLNELKFCSTDPIHFRIRFRKSDPGEIAKICKTFGMLP
jgi:RNA binding exosome subunit